MAIEEKHQNPQAEAPEKQDQAAAPEATQPSAAAEEQAPAHAPEANGTAPETEAASSGPSEKDRLEAELAKEHDNYLRLAAEYDNFRKRTQKEKDCLYTEIRAETVSRFLPVYDNLERALNQPTSDEAYRKGVEMTMNGLVEVLEKLGVAPFGEAGEAFDPAMHNAVMHVQDENLGESVLAEVFQKGFRAGDKVVRFAMVKVAN